MVSWFQPSGTANLLRYTFEAVELWLMRQLELSRGGGLLAPPGSACRADSAFAWEMLLLGFWAPQGTTSQALVLESAGSDIGASRQGVIAADATTEILQGEGDAIGEQAGVAKQGLQICRALV